MSMDLKRLKVAIVCDWLTGIGGAERVVLELHKIFPGAPIYTSQYDPQKIDWFKNADVRTTWLQKIPKRFKKFLPILRAVSFSHLDLSEYDLVISSSGAEAKGVKTGDNTIHISYIHSPSHYYWIRYDEYIKNPGFGKLDWLARLGLKLFVGPMRKWDRRAAQKPDYILTNSSFSQANIKKFYGRDSVVIHPPVELERFKNSSSIPRHGFVIAGRQTPYKRFDLAIGACSKLGLDLKVIGNGPDHQKLMNLSGPTIQFVENVSDSEMPQYFCSAQGFIFPSIDDFGIVAVEAMAAGTPVIAFGKGGVLDYLNETNGVTFDNQSVDSLAKSLENFSKKRFDSGLVAQSVKHLDAKEFSKNVTRFLNSL